MIGCHGKACLSLCSSSLGNLSERSAKGALMSPRSLSLGTLEEVPEEGLFVFVSLLVYSERKPRGRLSCLSSCVVCPLFWYLFVIYVALC